MFAASHLGRDHQRVGRNNQDGRYAGPGVVVVTDGCGSQPHSEVGAQLGARFLGDWLAAQPTVDMELPLRAFAALDAWLDVVAADSSIREQFFLFTVLAAVRRETRTIVFGLGDGGVMVDGALVRLDSGPDNAPDYCAYARRAAPQMHFFGECRQAVVMTDGLSALDTFRLAELTQLSATQNPLTLQRRLNVLAQKERFHDDATIAVLV